MSDECWTIVPLPADIDIANVGQVRAELMAVIDQGFQVVIADLSLTSFCDCAGVSALMAAGSQASRAGAELRVVARAQPVLRTFELTGLPLALRVYPTSSAAIHGAVTAALWHSLSRRVTRITLHRRAAAGESAQQPGQPQCP